MQVLSMVEHSATTNVSLFAHAHHARILSAALATHCVLRWSNEEPVQLEGWIAGQMVRRDNSQVPVCLTFRLFLFLTLTGMNN